MILSSEQYDYIEELTNNVKDEFEQYSKNLQNKDRFYEAMNQLENYIYNLIFKLES